jgi:hypothetical protein
MVRIFFTLSCLSIALLVIALWMGLGMGDLYAKPVASAETIQWARVHRLTGVAAALAVVFVESIAVTYFIGTSRWCREVVETYRLDMGPVAASNRLKRNTFPWALAGMLAVVGVIALGGASDPAATLQTDKQWWAQWHLVGAFVGVAFIAWTYFIEWINIVANQAIIENLVAAVGRIRRERGLDEDPAEQGLSAAAGPKNADYTG